MVEREINIYIKEQIKKDEKFKTFVIDVFE